MNEIMISNELFADVRKIIDEAKKATARSINIIMLAAYGISAKELLRKSKKVNRELNMAHRCSRNCPRNLRDSMARVFLEQTFNR